VGREEGMVKPFSKKIGSSQLIYVEGSINFYMAIFSKGKKVCGRAKRRGDGEVHERNCLSLIGRSVLLGTKNPKVENLKRRKGMKEAISFVGSW